MQEQFHRSEPIGPSGSSGRAGAPKGTYHASIALNLVFTLISFGLFNLYWNYRQMQACNALLGRREFSWLLWILLSLVTLGLYHFYYQYKVGAAINEIQQRNRLYFSEGLPILSVGVTLVGFGIITDCVHQYELNRIDAQLRSRAEHPGRPGQSPREW